MKQGWIQYVNCKNHYVNGVLHNDDGPATISKGGVKFWYKNGKLHRS